MLWGIYVVVTIFQKLHAKPLIYFLLQLDQADSTSLQGMSVVSMTFLKIMFS